MSVILLVDGLPGNYTGTAGRGQVSQADGFARGEGVGAVLLLPAAAASGHRVYANLLASAVNSDGRSNGITAPSQRAQRRVIEEALHRAGVVANQVSFVETHGTGTDLGDRIELAALAEVFGGRATPLYLGAAKANIAHCEGAAGIVAVIKAALCIHSRTIAPHCMAADIADSPVLARMKGVFPGEAVEWSVDGRRIAGISSFGMSGTNAHVIAATPLLVSEEPANINAACGYALLHLSARTIDSLNQLALSYAEMLEANATLDVHALSSGMLWQRQQWIQCKLAVAGSTSTELASRLRRRVIAVPAESGTRMVMLFTGQGSQYTNMSRQLYDGNTLFRDILDRHATQLDQIAGHDVPILSAIFTTDTCQRVPGELSRSQHVAQLSIFLIEYSLARLWIELGCKPVTVLGHSVGEYAAACVAGVMDFETAVRMLVARADAMDMACRAQSSTMLAISAAADAVAQIVCKAQLDQPSVWLAVFNSPDSTVIGGIASAVSRVREQAEAEGLACTLLTTQGAFHTPLMQSAAQAFESTCTTPNLVLSPPSDAMRFLSSVQGRAEVASSEICELAYWRDQISQPVDFDGALRVLLDEKPDFVLEVGPHAVLTALSAANVRRSGHQPRCWPSLDQRRNDMDTMLSAMAAMCERGILNARAAHTAWSGSSQRGPALALPSYPFKHDVFQPTSWENTAEIAFSRMPTAGSCVDVGEFQVRHTVLLDLEHAEDAWMTQHQIDNEVVLPGAFYISSACGLAERWLPPTDNYSIRLDGLQIGQPLLLPPGASSAEMAFELTGPDQTGRYTAAYRPTEAGGKAYAEVRLSRERGCASTPARVPTGAEGWQSAAAFYDSYAERGVAYGPLFRRVTRFQRINPMHVVCEIEAPAEGERLLLSHVAFLDSCLQSLGICAGNPARAFVPVAIETVRINPRAVWTGAVYCSTHLQSADGSLIEGDISVYSDRGEVLGQLSGVACVGISPGALGGKVQSRRVEWILQGRQEATDSSAKEGWLLLADEGCRDLATLEKQALVAGVQTHFLCWGKSGELRNCDSAAYDDLPQLDAIVFYAPREVLPLEAGYSSLVTLLRSIRGCVQAVLDRQPGRSVQFCIVDQSRAPNGLYELTWGAMLKALAVNLPSELPDLDVTYVAMPDVSSQWLSAVRQVRGRRPESGRGEIATCLWEVRDSSLWRRQTVLDDRFDAGKDPFNCRPDGRYLITGAFGGVGRHLVNYLIENAGCRHLVLLARGPLSAEANEWLEGIRSSHSTTEVEFLIADLADAADTERVLSGMDRPLHGIFHLAGANVDRPIANTDAAQLSQVINAKLGGAWALHCYAERHSELECFVLFSSLAALVPSPGQFVYALANAGLQDLAAHRMSLGLTAMVIDWGPWADTGMMNGIKGKSPSSALRRFSSMLPRRASEAFGLLMSRRPVENAIAHFAVFEEAKAPHMRPSAVEVGHAKVGPHTDLLSELISTETGHSASALDESLTLDQLGLDSVGLIRIRGELQNRLKVAIPASVFLDGNTLAGLRKHLREFGGEATGSAVQSRSDIAVAQEPLRVLMSYNQFSLWYEQNRNKHSNAYNCAIGWRLESGKMLRAALDARWAQLVAEHELLRAIFDDGGANAEPSYVVHSPSTTLEACPVIHSSVDSIKEVLSYARALLEEPTRLSSRFSTRVSLLQTSDQNTYLLLTSNHLVMDASTMFIVGVQLLEALCGNHSPPAAGGSPYRDFVQTQRNIQASELASAHNYFVPRLLTEEGALLRMELPYDRPLVPSDASGGSTESVPLSGDLAKLMAGIPSNRRAALCLSAWVLLLSRYSGQSRVVTGVAFNGRSQQRWRHTVGHFVNVLPLVVDVDETLPAAGLLDSVLRALFEMVDYQDIPLALVMRSERLKAAHHSSDLLQSYFNFFDASEMNVDGGDAGSNVSPLHIPQQESQFDLSLWVTQHSGSWRIDLKFRKSEFSQALAAQIACHYSHLLQMLAGAGTEQSPISLLPTLPPNELKPLEDGCGPLRAWVENADVPVGKCEQRVHEAFEVQALNRPRSIAIEWGRHRLDYGTLDLLANDMAAALRAQGVGKEHTVGLLLPRFGCPESVIAVLAIWKCGAAYVALDMRHPPLRIGYMVTTARCSLVITGFDAPSVEARSVLESILGLGLMRMELFITSRELSVVTLREAAPGPTGRLEPNSEYAGRDGQLAYVLFTSGSTGNPKGVLVEHKGLTERLSWMADHFSFGCEDKFLQGTVLTFDVSVPEFCLPLMVGGAIVLLAADDAPTSHARVCDAHCVTMMSTVPSLLNLLLDQLVHCRSLRHVISVGEALMRPVVEQWLSSGTQAVLHNLYGPTEATVYATYHACKAIPQTAGASIGVACPGVLCWVLDRRGRPVPPGVSGELYLGGIGIARGYVGVVRPPDPFCANPYQGKEARIYRTGDIAKWAADGELEYIGRNDFRVKLRGQLVELGEIEHVLMAQPAVKHAAVLLLNLGTATAQSQQIVACVISHDECEESLRSALQARLPEYMIPARIFRAPEFPLNGSGKVDRKALAAHLQERLRTDSESRRAGVPTELSDTQRRMQNLWQEILNLRSVSTCENFFQLGGDSLSLTRLVLAAEREFDVKIDFGRFVRNPTIDGLIEAGAHGPAARSPNDAAEKPDSRRSMTVHTSKEESSFVDL